MGLITKPKTQATAKLVNLVYPGLFYFSFFFLFLSDHAIFMLSCLMNDIV